MIGTAALGKEFDVEIDQGVTGKWRFMQDRCQIQ
jgi:hypothetical protein